MSVDHIMLGRDRMERNLRGIHFQIETQFQAIMKHSSEKVELNEHSYFNNREVHQFCLTGYFMKFWDDGVKFSTDGRNILIINASAGSWFPS